mmetsp:Transcript_19802/g.46213  ORF Transcript_19802/g.46213 Transcript_19802/m.46213 type:complete len:458 (+) Transcript_19802:4205-5578(+)
MAGAPDARQGPNQLISLVLSVEHRILTPVRARCPHHLRPDPGLLVYSRNGRSQPEGSAGEHVLVPEASVCLIAEHLVVAALQDAISDATGNALLLHGLGQCRLALCVAIAQAIQALLHAVGDVRNPIPGEAPTCDHQKAPQLIPAIVGQELPEALRLKRSHGQMDIALRLQDGTSILHRHHGSRILVDCHGSIAVAADSVAELIHFLHGIRGQEARSLGLVSQRTVVRAQLVQCALHLAWELRRPLCTLHPADVAGAERGGNLVHFAHNEEVLLAQRRRVETQVCRHIGHEVRRDVGGRRNSVAVDVDFTNPVLQQVRVELLQHWVHRVELEVIILEDLGKKQPSLHSSRVLPGQRVEVQPPRPVKLTRAAPHEEGLMPQEGRERVAPAKSAADALLHRLASLLRPVGAFGRSDTEVDAIYAAGGSEVLQPAPAHMVHLHVQNHFQTQRVGILHQLS